MGMNLRMQPSIDSLWEVLSILLPSDQTFHLLLGFFLGSCKILVKDIDLTTTFVPKIRWLICLKFDNYASIIRQEFFFLSVGGTSSDNRQKNHPSVRRHISIEDPTTFFEYLISVSIEYLTHTPLVNRLLNMSDPWQGCR
jgi:hypothetical protein